jgi:elongation factor P
VVEYQHIAPGNWRAMVRMKLKDFSSGKVNEIRVRAGDDIDPVDVETRPAQYLYNDGDLYYFMDNESYEQIGLSSDFVKESMVFVKENMDVSLMIIEGEVKDIEPPTFVTLAVTETGVAVRGDTATKVMKDATLETGAVIQVPDFIKTGDLVRVDTRSGEYLERGK